MACECVAWSTCESGHSCSTGAPSSWWMRTSRRSRWTAYSLMLTGGSLALVSLVSHGVRLGLAADTGADTDTDGTAVD